MKTDLWEKNLPAKYRDRAPRFPRIKIGTGVFVVEGRGATSFWQLGTDKQTVEWPWAS